MRPYATVIVAVIGTATVCVLVGLAIVFSGGVSWIVGGKLSAGLARPCKIRPEWRFAHNLEFTVGNLPDPIPSGCRPRCRGPRWRRGDRDQVFVGAG